jgi:hypothetical protein
MRPLEAAVPDKLRGDQTVVLESIHQIFSCLVCAMFKMTYLYWAKLDGFVFLTVKVFGQRIISNRYRASPLNCQSV